MRVTLLRFTLAIVALAATGCGDRSNAAASAKAKHEFHAPHGGTIIRLGREEYHLELVRDATAGRLTAYILDGEALNPVRTRASSFDIVSGPATAKRVLTFNAVEDPKTGETIGDTSRFAAEADWLKTTGRFDGELSLLKIASTTFLRVPISFPAGNEHR